MRSSLVEGIPILLLKLEPLGANFSEYDETNEFDIITKVRN